MALAIALLLAGVLLPCWGEFALFKKGSTKAGSLVCSQRTSKTLLHLPSGSGAQGGRGGTGHEAAKGFLPSAPRLRGAAAPMALAIALLLAGVLLPCWGEFALFKKGSTKANGARCSHHSECFSDCCLISLDSGSSFCAPRARITMTCLPQTRSAINIVCPCQVGLRCRHKDPSCSRRCHLI